MSELSLQEIALQYGNRLRIRATGICIENNAILLIKHHNLGKLGYLWTFPGGGLQFGETLEAAVRREFLEETGLDVEVKELIFVHQYIDLPLHSIEICFLVKKMGGILIKGIDPEISEDKQMIKQVVFLDNEQIQKIPLMAKHFKLRDIENFEIENFKKDKFSTSNNG